MFELLLRLIRGMLSPHSIETNSSSGMTNWMLWKTLIHRKMCKRNQDTNNSLGEKTERINSQNYHKIWTILNKMWKKIIHVEISCTYNLYNHCFPLALREIFHQMIAWSLFSDISYESTWNWKMIQIICFFSMQ